MWVSTHFTFKRDSLGKQNVKLFDRGRTFGKL